MLFIIFSLHLFSRQMAHFCNEPQTAPLSSYELQHQRALQAGDALRDLREENGALRLQVERQDADVNKLRSQLLGYREERDRLRRQVCTCVHACVTACMYVYYWRARNKFTVCLFNCQSLLLILGLFPSSGVAGTVMNIIILPLCPVQYILHISPSLSMNLLQESFPLIFCLSLSLRWCIHHSA